MDSPAQIDGGSSKRFFVLLKTLFISKNVFESPNHHKLTSRPNFGIIPLPFDIKSMTNLTPPLELLENLDNNFKITP